GRRRSRRNFKRDQKLAKKEPRAHFLVNQACIFSNPAETGTARIGTLEQRRGVDTDLPIEWPSTLAELFDQSLETAPHHVVVIFAPGVTRDPGEFIVIQMRRIGLGTVVKFAHADDGFRRW